MKKYTIEVSEKQLIVMERALELYTRLGLLQFDYLIEEINNLEYKNNKFHLDWGVKQKFNKQIREELSKISDNSRYEYYAQNTNAFRGVNNDEVPEFSKIACDLYQSYRYCRSWANAEHKPEERNKYFTEYMTVNYDAPLRVSNDEPLCKIEEKK